MIIVDYSQTIISVLMAEIGNKQDVEVDLNLLRHIAINNILSYKKKFGREYGDIVLACDSKKYWRKGVFPYYKANRKKARENSGLDWSNIFDSINTIKTELKTFFPYKVIEVEGAEADDVIATLVSWLNENDIKEGTIVPEPNPTLVLSGDHDFIQLQRFKHVKQYSPVQKKFVKPDTTPERYVLEHIFRGDKGDGIPNILTADDAIVNGERQKPVSSKKIEEWTDNPSSMPTDENFKRNFDRNKLLVDFSCIPRDLQDQILKEYVNYQSLDKSKLLNYFIEHKLKLMIEHLSEF